jgi:hypothetical protein
MVMPGTGGMSVAPLSPFNLADIRRPPGFGGTGKDPVWALKVQDLGPQLQLNIDKPTHGNVEPSTMMDIRDYERALGATAPRWRGPYWSPADIKF